MIGAQEVGSDARVKIPDFSNALIIIFRIHLNRVKRRVLNFGFLLLFMN